MHLIEVNILDLTYPFIPSSHRRRMSRFKSTINSASFSNNLTISSDMLCSDKLNYQQSIQSGVTALNQALLNSVTLSYALSNPVYAIHDRSAEIFKQFKIFWRSCRMSRIAQSFFTLYYGLYTFIKLCYALLADLIRHQFGVSVNLVLEDYKVVFAYRQKLLAELPVLKLNISDEKMLMLFDFFKNIPLPHSNSMMGFDDSVDGPIVPLAPVLVKRN